MRVFFHEVEGEPFSSCWVLQLYVQDRYRSVRTMIDLEFRFVGCIGVRVGAIIVVTVVIVIIAVVASDCHRLGCRIVLGGDGTPSSPASPSPVCQTSLIRQEPARSGC